MKDIFQYAFDDAGILCKFLNSILNLQGDHRIEAIQHIPVLKPDPANTYRFLVNVRCRSMDGRHALIEMQNVAQRYGEVESLLKHGRILSRLESAQTLEPRSPMLGGRTNDMLKILKEVTSVYTIVITQKSNSSSCLKEIFSDEAFIESSWVNTCELSHVNHFHRRFGDVPNQMVFLTIGDLTKSPAELSTSLERWCYLFKDDSDTKDGLIHETLQIDDPDVVAGDIQAIHHFLDRLKLENVPDEVRLKYLSSINDHNDAVLDMRIKNFKKGFKEGFKQSFMEGLKKTLEAMKTAEQKVPHDMEQQIMQSMEEQMQKSMKRSLQKYLEKIKVK